MTNKASNRALRQIGAISDVLHDPTTVKNTAFLSKTEAISTVEYEFGDNHAFKGTTEFITSKKGAVKSFEEYHTYSTNGVESNWKHQLSSSGMKGGVFFRALQSSEAAEQLQNALDDLKSKNYEAFLEHIESIDGAGDWVMTAYDLDGTKTVYGAAPASRKTERRALKQMDLLTDVAIGSTSEREHDVLSSREATTYAESSSKSATIDFITDYRGTVTALEMDVTQDNGVGVNFSAKRMNGMYFFKKFYETENYAKFIDHLEDYNNGLYEDAIDHLESMKGAGDWTLTITMPNSDPVVYG